MTWLALSASTISLSLQARPLRLRRSSTSSDQTERKLDRMKRDKSSFELMPHKVPVSGRPSGKGRSIATARHRAAGVSARLDGDIGAPLSRWRAFGRGELTKVNSAGARDGS